MGQGAVYKGRPQTWGVVQCEHFAEEERGSSDTDICTFWRKKFQFFEILVRPHEQGVLSQGDIFQTRGEWGGQFFAILRGGLLWTCPKLSPAH